MQLCFEHASDGVHDMPPQNTAFGILNTLSWKSLRRWQKQESPWPPPPLPVFPDKGHKTVLLEVPSLHSRSGASLSLKTKGHQEESGQTGLAKFSPVYYNYLILNLLYSFTTVPSSSNLAKKYRGLFLWVFIFLWRFLWHTKLNLYAFLLFFCFYQFTSETSPGTLRALRKTFSSHIPPIY